jgi:hypothetical protein
VSLKDKCHKLTLTATSEDKKQFLAGLYLAVRRKLDMCPAVLRGKRPELKLVKESEETKWN